MFGRIIKTESIPDKYTFIGVKKIHITPTSRVTENKSTLNKKKAVSLCNREVESEFNGHASRNKICSLCLRTFENRMEDAMYDQQAEEYYLPQEE